MFKHLFSRICRQQRLQCVGKRRFWLVASRMTLNPLKELETALTEGGLRAGLVFLNARVAHRCTAVYRLDSNVLRLVELVDKLNDKSSSGPPGVPLADSFCQFVIDNGPLLVVNAKMDARIIASPYRGPVVGYVGLPLTRSPGELFGTFCHYDFCEQPMPDEEYLFLHAAARLLPKFV